MSRTTTSRPKPWRDWNYATWLGNQRLYSLSRVLRDLDLKPRFDGANPGDVSRAAIRGKLTEYYCYRLLRGERVVVRWRHTRSLHGEVSDRVQIFRDWMAREDIRFVDAEDYVWSLDHRVCWKRDFRCLRKGKLTLVDLKCTSAPAKDWPLQIGCGLAYDEDGCERGGILQINPSMNRNGFKFREYNGAQVKAQYLRAVSHWHSRYDFNKLKNELGFDSEAMGLEIEEPE